MVVNKNSEGERLVIHLLIITQMSAAEPKPPTKRGK
jgi:hypothetical protein